MESRRLGVLAALVAGALAAALLGASAAGASSGVPADTQASANWAGYVAGGRTFTRVAASWVQPKADCASAQSLTASAFWVGLGGSLRGSNALEQAGTEADCTINGAAAYFAWYELAPAVSVQLQLTIHPGDRISTSVAVDGTGVTISIADTTRGTSFAKTLTMADPDTSSADWIAESPSVASPGGGVHEIPLTDFGRVTFTDASATGAGHSGSISDRGWSAAPVELRTRGGGFGYGSPGFEHGVDEAIPSGLSDGGARFTITWRTIEVGGYGGGYGGGGYGGAGPTTF